MALADALLSMFGVLSLALSVLLIKTKRIDVAMLLGFSLGGGMLTKSPAIFFYFFALLPFIFSLLTKKIKLREIFQFSLLFLIALIISQIMYGILRLGPAFEMIGSRNQDYLFSPSEVLRHPLNPLIGNLKSTAVWLFLLLTPSFLVALFIGLIPSQFSLSAIMLLTAFLVPALAQAFIAKVYTSRYILFAIYPLLPLISLGLFRLKKYAFLFVILPLVFSGLMIISPQKAPLSRDMRHGYLEEWTAGYGQKEVANYLKSLSIQGKKVVVFTEGFFGTLPDGLQIYVNKDPNITVVGSNPYVGQIPPGLKNTSPDNERFLVINKSRNHLNAGDHQNLTLIKEYPKAVRPEGTQEALQLYRYHAN
jgi:4-amino-4-deoxy-L-arabinose transferase-like glycosyltransferase